MFGVKLLSGDPYCRASGLQGWLPYFGSTKLSSSGGTTSLEVIQVIHEAEALQSYRRLRKADLMTPRSATCVELKVIEGEPRTTRILGVRHQQDFGQR